MTSNQSKFLKLLMKAVKNPKMTVVRTYKLGAGSLVSICNPMLARKRHGNMVMFHVGRSGSTVLGDLLDQNRDIYWDEEIYIHLLQTKSDEDQSLVAKPAADPLMYLAKRMKRAGRHFYGFEVKFFHLRLFEIGPQQYIDKLVGMGFTHFIILERKNLLRKIVSSIIGHKTGSFHRGAKGDAKLHRVQLDVENIEIDGVKKSLIEFLEDYQGCFAELKSLLNKHRSITVTYEDDIFENPGIGYKNICEFIGVNTKVEPHVHYGKTNPHKLSEIIVNYEQVAEELKDTDFAWMLND